MVGTTIIIGAHTISSADIVSITINESASVTLSEMASDFCEAIIRSDVDYLDSLPYATQVSVYRGSAILDVFYLTNVTRIKTDQYKLEMTSFLGILDGEMFYGGYYTGQELQDVIETIIQTNGLNLTTTDHSDMLEMIEYDAAFADLPIYGWLQVGTKKEALHQVLFSRGISMKKSSSGVIVFTSLYENDPIVIDEDVTYQDGDVTFLENVSTVEVVEHAFTNDSNADIQILFESEEQTEYGKEYIAVFNADAPVLRPIQVTGLTVSYQNCNAAVVTGVGTIQGYPAVHSQTVVRSVIKLGKGETATIEDCTLITRQNSAFMLDRFKNYFMTAETEISADIIKTNQKIGSYVSIINSFGERVQGYITEISQVLSGIIKASCKIVTGYKPLDYEGYNRFVVLTGSGGWAVPESVFAKQNPKVQVVLVGGGSGGYSGKAGENGVKVPYGNSSKTRAAGGAMGRSGDGGKILTVTIENPDSTLYYSCGAGGAGGAASSSHSVSNPGNAGGDTTITSGGTTYSSANGNRNENGVANIMSGIRYGIGNRVYIPIYSYPENGDGIAGFKSYWEGGSIKFISVGLDSPDVTRTWEYFDMTKTPPVLEASGAWANSYGQSSGGGFGGSPGGNAYGGQGAAGGNATSTTSGAGGKGADATVVFPKPNLLIGALRSDRTQELYLPLDDGAYGDGGFGGFGGGGGGSGGATNQGKTQGAGGAGGKGGAGGYGADGCIIVYY